MKKERYEIKEFFELIGKDNLEKTDPIHKNKDNQLSIEGYDCYKDSWRYRLFYQKGVKCACCGKEGAYFKPEASEENPHRIHFNLYAEDGTLMTKDHIYPKSKGGSDCLENFQVLCEKCNKDKGARSSKKEGDSLTWVEVPCTAQKEKKFKYMIYPIGNKKAHITYCEDDLDLYNFIIKKTLDALCRGNAKALKIKRASNRILQNLFKCKLKIENSNQKSFNFHSYTIERIDNEK